MKNSRRLLVCGAAALLGAVGLLGPTVSGCAENAENNKATSPTEVESDADTDADSDSDSDTDGDEGDAGATGDSRVDIIKVATTGDEGSYTFEVTFHSSDIDCSQYADWWEVLTEDGALLYRRILAHPHTEHLSGNPVMRSGGPVDILSTDTVIVRGHMNNGGYIGEAMRGSAKEGFESAPDIGPDFAAEVESAEPQPSTCIPEQDIVAD